LQAQEIDKLLARLYLDPRFRSELRADREAFARRYCAPADVIAAIDVDQLEFFAASLIRKRANEVLKLLPLTATAAGDRFHHEFARFAATSVPAGYNRHAADALAFCRYLSQENAGLVADAARFEAMRLEGRLKCVAEPGEPQVFRAHRRRFPRIRIARFSPGLRKILEPDTQTDSSSRRLTALFVAVGGVGEILYW